MFSSSGQLGEALWGCQGALGDLLERSSAALWHLWKGFYVILGFSRRHCLATFWGLLAVLREKIIPIWMQDCAKNQPKLEIVCSEKTRQKHKYFSGFYKLFWFWGLGKLRNCSNRCAKELKTTFQMRLGELRTLQTRQKGGSGRPNELPSLLPKATVDIGGAAFGRLGEAIIQIWTQRGFQTDPSWRLCAEPKHSKTYVFPRFWQLFWFWRVGNSRNCSNRWLKELKTRHKQG